MSMQSSSPAASYRLGLKMNVSCYETDNGKLVEKKVDKNFYISAETKYGLKHNGTGGTLSRIEVTTTPVSISVNKHIGGHNTVNAVLKAVAASAGLTLKELKDHYMDKSVRLNVEKSTDADKKIWTADYDVAQNYRVTEVKSVITRTNNELSKTYYLYLVIKSNDILLDMTEYSRAYTAKRLGEDILKGISGLHGSNVPYEISGMRVLKCNATNGPGATPTPLELKLPYLVQYNETEYSFLLRNANRCGEFLFFEGGKLNLGLAEGTIKDITDYASVESLSSAEPEKKASVYAHNAVHDCGAPNPDSGTYLSEYANEDYFSVIQDGGFDSRDARQDEVNSPLWSRALQQVFQYVNILSTLADWGLSEAALSNGNEALAEGDNKKIKNKYFYFTDCGAEKADGKKKPASMSDNEKWQYAKNKSVYLHTQFSDFFTTKENDSKYAVPSIKDSDTDQISLRGNISASDRPDSKAFFKMLMKEKEKERQQYVITFDSCTNNYNLGDIVTVKDISSDRFVVVAVSSEHTAKDDKLQASGFKEANRMSITVIPEDYDKDSQVYKPFPLPVDMDMVRRTGAMTAVVTDGDDPLRLGRVRVKFHWQNTDDSTPWIRVAVPFATKDDSGMQCNLAPDDEVMVNFENGNIERPYVEGALYNKTNTPPFGQRQYSMVLRSRNGHTIGFKDFNNSSTILKSFIPGLKFLNFIPQVAAMNIDSSKDIARRRGMGGIDITDYYGIYSISGSSDQRSISIDSPFGTVSMNAAMGITISAPNGNVKIVGKNVEISAGNNLTLSSGANIENAVLSTGNIHHMGEMGNAALNEVKELLAVKFTDLFNLPALRFAVELVFKPIAGTLKVHSSRYLLMEAGDGAANVPQKANRFTGAGRAFANSGSGEFLENRAYLLVYLKDKAAACKGYLSSYRDAYKRQYVDGKNKKDGLVAFISALPGLNANYTGEQAIAHITAYIDGAIINEHGPEVADISNTLFNAAGNDVQAAQQNDSAQLIKSKIDSLCTYRSNFINQPNGNVNAWEPAKAQINGKKTRANQNPQGEVLGDILTLARGMTKIDDEAVQKFSNSEDDILAETPTATYRTWVKNTLLESGNGDNVYGVYKEPADFNSVEAAWHNYVTSIEDKEADGTIGSYFRQEFGMKIADKLLPWDAWNVYAWEPASKGRIIMSQDKGQSISINGEALKMTPDPLTALKEVLEAPLP